MRLSTRVLSVLLVLVLALVSAVGCSDPGKTTSKPAAQSQNSGDKPAAAKDSKPDFPTKNIKFIVPVSPGGGFDTLARRMAPYWEKYLPNNAKVIVENKPGGEWKIGLSEINKAAPDGYTVGILNIPGNLTDIILGKKDAIDLTKFEYIGKISDVVYVLAVSKQSGIKNWDDFKNSKKELKNGTVSLASTGGIGSVIIHEAAGVKNKIIPHDGSNESILSAIRGTVDTVMFPYNSLEKAIVDSNDLIPIVVVADDRHPKLPNVPTIGEVGLPELTNTIQLHRLVAATPGTPPEILKILRDSFAKAQQDPEFKKKMMDEDGIYHPADHKRSKEIIEQSLKNFAKYAEMMEKYRK